MDGLVPNSYHPMSRDWHCPDIPCGRHDCITNTAGVCFVPSRCVIGEDGKCVGYAQESFDNPRSGD